MNRAASSTRQPRPRLLELVGPSGAGKTTVLEELLARGDRVERKPTLRKVEYAGVVASAVAAAVGTVVRCRVRSAATIEQVLLIAYVEALPRLLDRGHLAGANIIAFDQGPLYFLSRPRLLDERLAPWRESLFDTWASLLDLVVWLDAGDDVLTERINSRSKWHSLKGVEHERAAEVLTTSRRVYEDAVSGLTERRPRPAILRFDTERRPAGEIADAVLAALAVAAR